MTRRRGIDPGRLYSSGELALILGVHPRTVGRWADRGWLTARRTMGGDRRFLGADVLRRRRGGRGCAAGLGWPL